MTETTIDREAFLAAGWKDPETDPPPQWKDVQIIKPDGEGEVYVTTGYLGRGWFDSENFSTDAPLFWAPLKALP